jgi:probable phosphoglycerate mutase
MRLLFVRHGQMALRASQAPDLATLDRFFSQELEEGLSAQGRREAADVAAALEAEPPDRLYSSPMLRARQTAQATERRLGVTATVLPGLAELRTGALPPSRTRDALARLVESPRLPFGLKRTLVGATLVPLYYRSWRRAETVGGETEAALLARIDAVLERVVEDGGERVALFAHGYLIRTLLKERAEPSAAFELLRRPYLPNGSITELRRSRGGTLHVLRYANATHLR